MTEHLKGRAVVTSTGAIITCRLIGDIDGVTVKQSMKDTRDQAIKIRESGLDPVLLISIAKITSQTSEARGEAKTLTSLGFKKVAVSGGKGLTLSLGHYIAKAAGMGDYTRFFRTEMNAKLWLNGDKVAGLSFYEKSKFVSIALILILAVSAIIGWAYDITLLQAAVSNLKSMNPMVGVTLIILALSLLFIDRNTHKSRLKKTIVLIGATWSIFFGFSVLLRHYTNIDLGIDLFLFENKLDIQSVFSGRAAFGAGLLSILTGTLLAFFSLRKQSWWILNLFYTLSFGAFLIVLAATIGYAFGIPVLYQWNNQLPIPINTVVAFGILNFTLSSLMKPIASITWSLQLMKNYWQGVIVFLILVVATGIVFQQLENDNNKTVNNAASDKFLKTDNNIRSSLGSYSTVLSGFKGFINSSTDITPEEFRAYYLNSGIDSDYPGFVAILYAPIVPKNEVKAFTTLTRSRASATFPGYAKFNIFQTDSNVISDVHYPVLYVEPSLPTTSYGFDLSTEQARRTTLEKATKTGEATISDIIDLRASTKIAGQPHTERPGFFIALSLGEFSAASPTRINTKNDGFVLAYFETTLLFENIFKESLDDNAQYTLSDSQTKKAVYTTVAKNITDKDTVKNTSIITIGGRQWLLTMTTSPDFAISHTAQRIPLIALIGGLSVALLGAGLIIIQLRRRDQALSLAENMTTDLNSERNLAIAAKNKNDAILSSIGDAVFAIDVNERITLFNAVSEKITGFSAEEVIGKPYKDYMIFADDKSHEVNNKFIEKALQGKNSSMDEFTVLKRKDGSYVYVADSAAPIRDSKNELLGVIVVFRDITNEQQLDRAKTEFVSLASHQLRTPLSAINWYSELLLGGDAGELSEDQITYIKEIFEGNQRMIELVNSLLDVSRLDLGKLDNVPVDVNTVELIESLQKEMTPLIVHKKIEVKKNIKSSPVMSVEPKLIRMIIQNILSNAIKYTPDGGTVTITAKPASSESMAEAHIHSKEPHLLLTIQDTGYGIPKEQQGKIYTKMFRADNVRVLDVEGTGLGLYIVKEVVDKLHGRIRFESAENKGTTFYIILPVKTKPVKL
jgi:PAS domain S-box-containing protein